GKGCGAGDAPLSALLYVWIYVYHLGMSKTRRRPRPAGQSVGPSPAQLKTRITIYLDGDLLAWFRNEVKPTGGSYQRAINLALRDYIAREPLEATLRRVVREEIAAAFGRPPSSGYSYEPATLVADGSSEYGAIPGDRGTLRGANRKKR